MSSRPIPMFASLSLNYHPSDGCFLLPPAGSRDSEVSRERPSQQQPRSMHGSAVHSPPSRPFRFHSLLSDVRTTPLFAAAAAVARRVKGKCLFQTISLQCLCLLCCGFLQCGIPRHGQAAEEQSGRTPARASWASKLNSVETPESLTGYPLGRDQ